MKKCDIELIVMALKVSPFVISKELIDEVKRVLEVNNDNNKSQYDT